MEWLEDGCGEQLYCFDRDELRHPAVRHEAIGSMRYSSSFSNLQSYSTSLRVASTLSLRPPLPAYLN